MTKKTITKRTWKLLLGICIAAVLSIGIGLFAYIHMIDTKTLGRKISIYGLDVSKLTAEKAQQKINEAFHNKNIIFHEDGEDVYSVSMAQLGYSLEQDSLRNELETLQQERSQDFRLFASEKDYTIDYQIIKNENQEKTALAAENFDNKERTESADAHIRYSKKKKKYILVKQVQGNQIDENRLLNYVEETLEKNFKTKLLASDVKINLGEEVYRQPDIEESGEMKQKVKKLNSLLKKYRSTTVTYLFGEETQVLESDTISSWLQIKNSGISLDKDAVADYISNMANKYNTIYVPRAFHTSLGTDVTVSDNEYGYRIDQDAELTQWHEEKRNR